MTILILPALVVNFALAHPAGDALPPTSGIASIQSPADDESGPSDAEWEAMAEDALAMDRVCEGCIC